MWKSNGVLYQTDGQLVCSVTLFSSESWAVKRRTTKRWTPLSCVCVAPCAGFSCVEEKTMSGYDNRLVCLMTKVW